MNFMNHKKSTNWVKEIRKKYLREKDIANILNVPIIVISRIEELSKPECKRRVFSKEFYKYTLLGLFFLLHLENKISSKDLEAIRHEFKTRINNIDITY